jgi:hypothetical protein
VWQDRNPLFHSYRNIDPKENGHLSKDSRVKKFKHLIQVESNYLFLKLGGELKREELRKSSQLFRGIVVTFLNYVEDICQIGSEIGKNLGITFQRLGILPFDAECFLRKFEYLH